MSTLVLVPAVVDVAGDVPVLAAGGIADGRGLAAALALGAAGASLGTRFLATEEMTIDATWKQRIVAADAEEAVKVPHSERVMPPFNVPQLGMPFAPRALRTPLIDRLADAPEEVDPATVGPAMLRAVRAGGGHDLLPFTGQSAELVHDVVPPGRSWPGSSPRRSRHWTSRPRRTGRARRVRTPGPPRWAVTASASAASSARAASSSWAICASSRQISARMRADPTKANQNGPVTPQIWAMTPPSAWPATMPPKTPIE